MLTISHFKGESMRELATNLDTVHDGLRAMQAIGDLLMNECLNKDEQLNMVMRSQVAIVFQFFSKQLTTPLLNVLDTTASLELTINKYQP